MDKYKKAGFKLLLTHVKKKYPFVINIIPNLESFYKYGTLISFDIEFDLAKFYKVTGTQPPENYFTNEYLLELLELDGAYLMRYVDDSLRDEYSSNYNEEFIKHMSSLYSNLPSYMRYSVLEGFSNQELANVGMSLESLKRWQEKEEPLTIHLNLWKPKVDFDKIKDLM